MGRTPRGRDERDEDPDDDKTPETPPTEPDPVPINDPPPAPEERGPLVVRVIADI